MDTYGIDYFMAKNSRTIHNSYIKRIRGNKTTIVSEGGEPIIKLIDNVMYVYPTRHKEKFIQWGVDKNYKIEEIKYDT